MARVTCGREARRLKQEGERSMTNYVQGQECEVHERGIGHGRRWRSVWPCSSTFWTHASGSELLGSVGVKASLTTHARCSTENPGAGWWLLRSLGCRGEEERVHAG